MFCLRSVPLPPPPALSATPFVELQIHNLLWIVNVYVAKTVVQKNCLLKNLTERRQFQKSCRAQNNFVRNIKLTCANSSISMVTRQAATMVAANQIKTIAFIATVVKIILTLVSI